MISLFATHHIGHWSSFFLCLHSPSSRPNNCNSNKKKREKSIGKTRCGSVFMVSIVLAMTTSCHILRNRQLNITRTTIRERCCCCGCELLISGNIFFSEETENQFISDSVVRDDSASKTKRNVFMWSKSNTRINNKFSFHCRSIGWCTFGGIGIETTTAQLCNIRRRRQKMVKMWINEEKKKIVFFFPTRTQRMRHHTLTHTRAPRN